MEREVKDGFKFYLRKNQIPYSYMNLIQHVPFQEIQIQNSLGKDEDSNKNQHTISKHKFIQKDKDKQEPKKYDRGGNCVASNTSKLFIKILNKRLNKFPIIQNYLSFYQIYSQKENILLIPLCLYSFLKQYEHNSPRLFHFQNAIAQRYLPNQKINTRRIYLDIINQLKQHIDCSLQNSRAKYKDCIDCKKQFHLKNISIYNKISQIIKKVQQLGLGLQDHTGQHENRIRKIQKQKLANDSLKNSLEYSESQIKCEEEELHYNQSHAPVGRIVEVSIKPLFTPLSPYTISSFSGPLQSLYERKQREYQKAMDKVFCIILNQTPLRSLFNIYKLEIKDILLDSVNYCYRRNINSRVKKNQKMLKQIYQKMEQTILSTLGIKASDKNQGIELRGWEFLLAYLTLRLSGDKKDQIYEQFKDNIRRKTRYYNIVQDSTSTDRKESFDKQYYAFSLRLLDQNFVSKKGSKKQDLQDREQLMGQLKQWMIGYYYNQTLNRILLQNPRYTAHCEGKGQHPTLTDIPCHDVNYFHNGQLMQMNPLSTEMTFEIKMPLPSSSQPNLTHPQKLVPVHQQQKRSNQFFGTKQDLALSNLISKFQQIVTQNLEGIA